MLEWRGLCHTLPDMDWIEKTQNACDHAEAVLRAVVSVAWFVFKFVLLFSFLGGIAYHAVTG
jgi:hypothetical protein